VVIDTSPKTIIETQTQILFVRKICSARRMESWQNSEKHLAKGWKCWTL